eukprot:757490-Rhodomonas_salina.1
MAVSCLRFRGVPPDPHPPCPLRLRLGLGVAADSELRVSPHSVMPRTKDWSSPSPLTHLHCEIKYKKPQSQYNLYHECVFLCWISGGMPRTKAVGSCPPPFLLEALRSSLLLPSSGCESESSSPRPCKAAEADFAMSDSESLLSKST